MKRMTSTWPLAAALLGLAGCGSDQWVDIPALGCDQLETNRAEVEVNINGTIGPGICLQAGGLTYGEEYRCRDDKVQVLCRKP